ncbi:hypothetical protein JOB18_035908 [Solea senegalensis]|uniref:Uncharacterized protein n=1 Tax=Solea senegalensis TaxID=28829 RepID=A0AAV6S9D9_SOLSE|nr:hypothetical protein JOB18_035908 [Solea senegalensis]
MTSTLRSSLQREAGAARRDVALRPDCELPQNTHCDDTTHTEDKHRNQTRLIAADNQQIIRFTSRPDRSGSTRSICDLQPQDAPASVTLQVQSPAAYAARIRTRPAPPRFSTGPG